MSYENWKNKAQGFQTVDVRHIQGSFFEGLKKRAEALEVGEGLHIIQTFEPHECQLGAYESLIELNNEVALLYDNGKIVALIGYVVQ